MLTFLQIYLLNEIKHRTALAFPAKSPLRFGASVLFIRLLRKQAQFPAVNFKPFYVHSGIVMPQNLIETAAVFCHCICAALAHADAVPKAEAGDFNIRLRD